MGRLLFQLGDIIYYRAETGNGGHTPKKEGGPKGAEHQPWVSLDDEPTKERLKQVTGLTELQLWQIQTAGLNIQNKQEHAPQKERLTARTFLKDLIFDPTGALDLEKDPVETLSKFVNGLEKQGISKEDLIQAWLATFPHFRFDFDENGLKQLLTDVGIPQEEQTQIIQAFNNIKEQAPNIEDLKQPAMFKIVLNSVGEPIGVKILYGRNPALIKENRGPQQARGLGGIFVINLGLGDISDLETKGYQLITSDDPSDDSTSRTYIPRIGCEIEGMCPPGQCKHDKELYGHMVEIAMDPVATIDDLLRQLRGVLEQLEGDKGFIRYALTGIKPFPPYEKTSLHTLWHLFRDSNKPGAQYVVRMVEVLVETIRNSSRTIKVLETQYPRWAHATIVTIKKTLGHLYSLILYMSTLSEIIPYLAEETKLGGVFPFNALHLNLSIPTFSHSLITPNFTGEFIAPNANQVIQLANAILNDPLRRASSQYGLPPIFGEVLTTKGGKIPRSARQLVTTAAIPLAHHNPQLPQTPGELLQRSIAGWTTGPANPDPGRTFTYREMDGVLVSNYYGGGRLRVARSADEDAREAAKANRFEVSGQDATFMPAIPAVYAFLLHQIVLRLQLKHPEIWKDIYKKLPKHLDDESFMAIVMGTYDPQNLKSPLLTILSQKMEGTSPELGDNELEVLLRQANTLATIIHKHYEQDYIVVNSDNPLQTLENYAKNYADRNLPDELRYKVSKTVDFLKATTQTVSQKINIDDALAFSRVIYNSIQQGHKLSPYVLFRIGTEVYNLDPTTTALILTQFAEASTEQLIQQLSQATSSQPQLN